MKQLFFTSALMLVCLSLSAQLYIRNDTPCPYYYEIFFTNASCMDQTSMIGGIINACSTPGIDNGSHTEFRIRISSDGSAWSTWAYSAGCSGYCVSAGTICSGATSNIKLNANHGNLFGLITDSGNCTNLGSCP